MSHTYLCVHIMKIIILKRTWVIFSAVCLAITCAASCPITVASSSSVLHLFSKPVNTHTLPPGTTNAFTWAESTTLNSHSSFSKCFVVSDCACKCRRNRSTAFATRRPMRLTRTTLASLSGNNDLLCRASCFTCWYTLLPRARSASTDRIMLWYRPVTGTVIHMFIIHECILSVAITQVNTYIWISRVQELAIDY